MRTFPEGTNSIIIKYAAYQQVHGLMEHTYISSIFFGLQLPPLAESSNYIHFHRDMSAPAMSIDMSQVGVSLLPSF